MDHIRYVMKTISVKRIYVQQKDKLVNWPNLQLFSIHINFLCAGKVQLKKQHTI